MIKETIFAISFITASMITASISYAESPAQTSHAKRLNEIVAQRSTDHKQRDAFRHPAQTLSFFDIREGMTVVETPVEPVYAGERSGLRPWHFFLICGLIASFWLSLRRLRSRHSQGGRASAHADERSRRGKHLLGNRHAGLELAAHHSVLNDRALLGPRGPLEHFADDTE